LVPASLFYLDDAQLAAARQRLSPQGIREQIAQNEALIAAPGPAAATIAKVTLQDPLRLHDFILDRLMPARPFATYQNSEAFITADGRSLLIRLQGSRPPSDIEFSKAFCAAIETLAAKANTDNLRLDFAGAYPIARASERAIRSDMVASITGSVIGLQLLFLLVYRKPVRIFILAFAPVAIGVLVGFGASALVQSSISPLAAVIGAVLGGLAIDYSVYFINDYEAQRQLGLTPREAAKETALTVAPPVFAAWLTSAIGFIAVGWSSIPAIRQFAALGTLGLTGAFAAALLLLPAVLALCDRRATVARPQMRFSTLPLLHGIIRFRKPLIGLGLLLLLAAVTTLVRAHGRDGVLPLEHDLTVMHPHPNPALQAQGRIAERFGTSPDAMLLYLRAPSPEQLVSLAHTARQRLTQAASEGQGGIRGTFGLADLLPDPQFVPRRLQEVNPQEAQRVVADFKAAIADSSFNPDKYEPYAQFLQTMLSARKAPGVIDLMDYPSLARNFLPASAIDAKTPPHDAIMLVFTRTSLDNRAERDAAIDTIRHALAGIEGITLTGIGVLGHDTELLVARDLPRLVGIASILVVLYLLVHFRRPVPALLAILPMAGSLLLLLAAGRLAGEYLNMVNLVAAPLLIGIDVDYGIFLVSVAASRANFTRQTLARRIDSGCNAILTCVLSALLGFGTLYFTSVPAIGSLGFAVAVGVTGCMLLVFLLVLPILFARTKEGPEV
jgi:uncharacterized protein